MLYCVAWSVVLLGARSLLIGGWAVVAGAGLTVGATTKQGGCGEVVCIAAEWRHRRRVE